MATDDQIYTGTKANAEGAKGPKAPVKNTGSNASVDTEGLKALESEISDLTQKYESGEMTWPAMLQALKNRVQDAIDTVGTKKPLGGMGTDQSGIDLTELQSEA